MPGLLVLLTSCAQSGQHGGAAGPARPSGPAPAADLDASDARLDAPVEPTAEQRARLVAELENLKMTTIGAGPGGQTSEPPAPSSTAPPPAAPPPGGAAKVPGPRAVIQMAAAVGGPAGANAVLASARAGFRRCYQRALAEDPETTGTVTLTLTVGPDGNVAQAASATNGKFTSSLSSCLETRARVLKFAVPSGSSNKLVVTLTLVRG